MDHVPPGSLEESPLGPTDLETTGRFLVLMREEAVGQGVQELSSVAGLRVARLSELADRGFELERGEAIVVDRLDIAIVNAPPDQLAALSGTTTGQSVIVAIEPERVVHVLAPDHDHFEPPPAAALGSAAVGVPRDYLLGYRDAVNHLVDGILAKSVLVTEAAGFDETRLTWGVQVTNAATSPYTGAGVHVAVLDTGLDLGHPDFAGRRVTSQSFVPGETVQDGHGHGTHCIGTACGPRQPTQLPRYGVACEAEIFVGKVLNNEGRGVDGNILAGIGWAVQNGCTVVSMSLGAELLDPAQRHSLVFEAAAQRALAQGTLIVAAAGNGSGRPGLIRPVSHPANCPSIMAVGAIDQRMQVADFSNAGLNPQGGQIDVAAPGVDVRSSWPRPTLYRTISGTSMATPHVAGIAALFAQAPQARGQALGGLLTQNARRLTAPSRDVGVGLVQAP